MPRRSNLADLSAVDLMDLRAKVEEALTEKRRELEKQISLLGELGNTAKGKRSLKGRKIPAKYQDDQGNTWAGRGARPKWLVGALKKGKKLDSFLVK
jgi:DNA-binding protein H-NS